MYLKIESEFNRKSKNRKSQLIYVLAVFGYAVLLSLILTFLVGFNNDTLFVIVVILGMLLFGLSCYAYLIFKVSKTEKITFSKVISFDEIRNKYNEIIHKEDLKILKAILKENGVNTRPKVQEVLRHYQAVLPKRTVASSQLLSILALTISIIALLFSESMFHSVQNVAVGIAIIFLVILGYIIVKSIGKYYFRFFGKNALYERMEAAISEIYMDYAKKEDKE